MAIKNIRVMGDPCLYEAAKDVELAQIGTPFIQEIITDLIDTLADSGGVGIAAPQIGIPLRIIILNIDAERASAEHCAVAAFEARINPTIIQLSEDRVDGRESCLSLPGLAGVVPRSKSLVYESYNCHGEKSTYEADDFMARVIQHELDHLDGQLYWSKVKNMSTFGFVEHFLSAEELKVRKHSIDKQRATLLKLASCLDS